MHPKAAIQAFIGTEIEAPAVINFWVKFRTVRTDLARISRAVQFCFGTVFEEKRHGFRGDVPAAYSVHS
jgi:hypothetical protein